MDLESAAVTVADLDRPPVDRYAFAHPGQAEAAGAWHPGGRPVLRDLDDQAAAAAAERDLRPVRAGVLVIAESHDRTRHRSDLTAREHEVLTLLAKGLSNSQIADLLIIGDATV